MMFKSTFDNKTNPQSKSRTDAISICIGCSSSCNTSLYSTVNQAVATYTHTIMPHIQCFRVWLFGLKSDDNNSMFRVQRRFSRRLEKSAITVLRTRWFASTEQVQIHTLYVCIDMCMYMYPLYVLDIVLCVSPFFTTRPDCSCVCTSAHVRPSVCVCVRLFMWEFYVCLNFAWYEIWNVVFSSVFILERLCECLCECVSVVWIFCDIFSPVVVNAYSRRDTTKDDNCIRRSFCK